VQCAGMEKKTVDWAWSLEIFSSSCLLHDLEFQSWMVLRHGRFEWES
jgi:hypothetical protein